MIWYLVHFVNFLIIIITGIFNITPENKGLYKYHVSNILLILDPTSSLCNMWIIHVLLSIDQIFENLFAITH